METSKSKKRRVTQTSVHVKMDTLTLAWLRNIQYQTGMPLNRVINQAAAFFVRYYESRKRYGLCLKQGEFAELCNRLMLPADPTTIIKP